MADIDTSEYDRKRYFAALGMMLEEVFKTNEDFKVDEILKRYNLRVYADSNRVRVGIRLDGLTDEQVEEYRKSKENCEKE